jgi:hypothetical protein
MNHPGKCLLALFLRVAAAVAERTLASATVPKYDVKQDSSKVLLLVFGLVKTLTNAFFN